MFELLELGLCNKYFYGNSALVIISLFGVAIIGYLLGSLNFGVIISKAFYKDDVRKHGSGNAGMTNILRTYGKFPAAMTFLGDGLKTALAILIGALLLGSHNTAFYNYNGVIYSNFNDLMYKLAEAFPGVEKINLLDVPNLITYEGYAGMYIGGVACILGHCYPLYYKFKGGKGVVAAFFMVLCTSPVVGLICLAFFIAIVAGTKYISLGSIMSIMIYPLILYKMTGLGPHNIIAICIMLFVIFLHRANIKRLLNGEENKFSLKSKKKKDESQN